MVQYSSGRRGLIFSLREPSHDVLDGGGLHRSSVLDRDGGIERSSVIGGGDGLPAAP
jgi:hypothetical protein